MIVEGLSKRDAQRLSGRTDHNDIVCFPAGRELTGRRVAVRIDDCTPLTLLGELL